MNLIGESFDNYVAVQVDQRQKYYGSTSGLDASFIQQRTEYLYNKQPFTKLVSSVNITANKLKELGLPESLAKEGLAKMESRAAKMEEQAPWMALAKAGFEMASSRPEYGKGQSALADIARGAGVGIKDFAESRDKLNTLEEKRFNIENDLAKANRAEQMAIAKYGADSKQAAEARAHADKLHNSSISTQYKIAELNATVNNKTD